MPHTKSGDCDIYYEVHGDPAADALLCIGGWGLLTGDHFSHLPEKLRSSYRVVVYDHRGLGRSGPDNGPGSTEKYAEDAISVLAAAGVARAHVVGQGGLGAGVGQIIAATAPQLVQSLVLASGWVGPETFHDFQLAALLKMRREFGFEAFRQLCVTYTHPPAFVNDNPSYLPQSWAGQGNIHERGDAHIALIEANLAHNARDLLHRIDCPTLVVCGEHDHLGGPRLAKDLAERIGGSQLEVLPGVPHAFGSVEGGAELYRDAVQKFLSAHAFAPRS